MPTTAAFAIPTFDAWAIIYTAFGAMVFWGKWGNKKLKPFLLSTILDALFHGQDTTWRQVIEFTIFICFGVLIGVGFTSPQNPAQAVAAGLGWTGLLTSHKH